MATNNRISTLPEVSILHSDVDYSLLTNPTGQADDDVLFLITKSGAKNEKITFKTLKNSILSNTVSVFGDQTISGEKTFADICTFEDTVFLNEVIDTSYSGDISGYLFIGETGVFEKIGVGPSFANKTRSPQYTLHVEGDTLIEGEFTVDGALEFQGGLGVNDVNASGNLTVEGDVYFNQNLNVSNDINVSGNLFVDGDTIFKQDAAVSGDLNIGSKIIHNNDQDTFVEFAEDQISMNAGVGNKLLISQSEIEFYIGGEKKSFIDDQGRFGINTQSPLGELTVGGDAYIENIYVTGQNGGWEKITPKGYDEAVNFTTNLNQGQDTYQINFPKTFGTTPTVNATLKNNGGGEVLYFNILNVEKDSFSVAFNKIVPNDNYSIETKAVVDSQYSLHETVSKSFRSQIIEGATEYTINYPTSFTKTPVVSVSLEGKTSYAVNDSGISGDSFIDGDEYYLAVDTDTWRRVTLASVTRDTGNEGDVDFDDDFYYVCLGGTSWGRAPLAESSKIDPGSLGDIDYDNNFLYVFTSTGWKETAIATWPSSALSKIVPYMISDITETSFKINFESILTSQYYVHSIISR